MPAPNIPNTKAAHVASGLYFQKRRFTRYLTEMRAAGYVVTVAAPSNLPEKFRAS